MLRTSFLSLRPEAATRRANRTHVPLFSAILALVVATTAPTPGRGDIPPSARGDAHRLLEHFESFEPGDPQYFLDWDELSDEEIAAIEEVERQQEDASEPPSDWSPEEAMQAAARCTQQPECYFVVQVPSICLEKGKYPPPSTSNPDSTRVVYAPQPGGQGKPEFLDIYDATTIAQQDGTLVTPFASHPERERYQVAQNASWMRATNRDDDPNNDVTRVSIRETVHEQIEKTTGRSFDSLPPATQQQVDLGADQLFDAISTIEKQTRQTATGEEGGGQETQTADAFDPQPDAVVVAVHPPDERPSATDLETGGSSGEEEQGGSPAVGFVPGLSTGPPAGSGSGTLAATPVGFALTGNDVASGPDAFGLQLNNPTGRPVTLLVGEGTVLAPTCANSTGEGCDLAASYQTEMVPESISIVLVPCPREDCTEVPDPPGDHTASIGGIATTANDPIATVQHEPQAGGDPVFLHSGEVFVEASDLELPGRGLDWSFQRTYRSQHDYDGPLGWNWDFSDNLRLLSQGADLVFYDGTGQAFTYVLGTSPGSAARYFSPMGGPGALVAGADGSWMLRRDDGLRFEFGPLDRGATAGKIRAVVGPDGDRIEYRYDKAGRLTETRDTLGRAVTYRYGDNGRIAEVRDFSGRAVRFRYDAAGNLTHVTSPSITGTPTGNDFPDGRTTRYGYITRNASPRLLHNLISITAPTEVASGGPRRVTMSYDEHDRLIAHLRGGTGADGKPVGGTIRYEYSRLAADGSLNAATPVYRTRVTYRDETKGDFLFNYQGLLVERDELDAHGRPIVTRLDRDALGRVTRIVYPEGNQRIYRYARRSFDPVAEVLLPDKPRGAAQPRLVTHLDHEPVFDQLVRRVAPRALERGAAAGARSTLTYYLDYQEDRSQVTIGGRKYPAPLPRIAKSLGFAADDPAVLASLARDLRREGIPLGLGDLNGDGREESTATGRIVRIEESANVVASDGRGSEATSIVTRFRYNAFGQLVESVDPEGHVTRFTYYPLNDPDGDGKPTPGVARQEGGGFLASAEIDAGTAGAARPLRVAWLYDELGRVRATTDPRGVTTEFHRNQVDELVRVVAAVTVKPGVPGLEALGVRTDLFWDANGRLVKRSDDVRGERLASDVGPSADTEYAYSLLDDLVEIRQEVANGRTRAIRIAYDAMQRPTTVSSPVAVAGAQANARTGFTWGPGDVLLSRTRGSGSPAASTARFEYDKNGDLVAATDAEDNDGDGRPEARRFRYDGFDRLVEVVERDGASARFDFDADSNVVQESRLDRPANGGAAAATLERTQFRYDEAGRLFEVAHDRLSPAGALVDRVRFDRLGRPVAEFEDGRAVATTTYDGAGRIVRQADAAGNELLTEYDDASNPIREVAVERPSDSGAPLRVEHRSLFDALGRLTRWTDSLGRTTRYEYGARSLPHTVVNARSDRLGADPLRLLPMPINLDGDRFERTYDALGRIVAESTLLGGAPPAGNADGAVTTRYEWDDADRLTARVDDLGNTTRYVWDELGRVVSIRDAAGGESRIDYDRDDHAVRTRTASGELIEGRWDGADRQIERRLHGGDGSAVAATTTQRFVYDGLGRLIRATDDNDPKRADDDTEVVRRYDALSRLVEESQNGRTVGFDWKDRLGVERLRYPSGQTSSYELDPLGRPGAVKHSLRPQPLARFAYVGEGRMLRAAYANGATLDYRGNAGAFDGLDAEGRTTRQRWTSGGAASSLVDLSYERDGIGRITSIAESGSPKVAVRRDAVGALIGFGDLSWSLDGAGNWRGFGSSASPKSAAVSAGNRYTTFDGSAQAYDADGRRQSDGSRSYVWDPLGRLREVHDAEGRLLARYGYDALGRRTLRADGAGRETRYVYAGDQVVEERDGAGAATRQFVLGNRETGPFAQVSWSGDASARASILYSHLDRHPGNVAALTDESGQVVASFRYGPFGSAVGPAAGSAESVTGWPYGYHGARRDPATGLYQFGARDYDPEQGRFLSLDPGGEFADPAARGNGYALGASNGVDGVDSTGLYWQEVEGGGVKWMGKPGEEDYGFTTVKQLPGSWFEWRPDYVFEPSTPSTPAEPKSEPEAAPEPEPEGAGWGTQLGLSEDPLWHINAKKLDSKANQMLRDFVWTEAFSSLGMAMMGPLQSALNSHPVLPPPPRSRYVQLGGQINLANGMKSNLRIAERMEPLEGFFDVIAHGSRNRVLMVRDGKLARLDHLELAKIIRETPGWNNQNVRLLSCRTGESAKGIAANLADELGVMVYAPNKPIWFWPLSRPGKVGVGVKWGIAGRKWLGGKEVPNWQDPGQWVRFPLPR